MQDKEVRIYRRWIIFPPSSSSSTIPSPDCCIVAFALDSCDNESRNFFIDYNIYASEEARSRYAEIGRKHCSARFFFRLDPRIFESMGYCFECCSRVGFVATNLKSELEMFTFSFFGLARSIRINYLRIMRKANINICENENKRAEPVQIVCFKLFAIFLSSVI